jgi:septal ring factor EnvC (AmiA/AmiB activator)
MTWMFLVLSLAAAAYLVYLILEHLRDAGLIDAQIDRQQQEQKNVEFSIERSEIDRDAAKTGVVEIEQEVKQLQITTDDLQSQISDLNKDKERRGKFRVGGS